MQTSYPEERMLVSAAQRHVAARMLDKAYDLGFIDEQEHEHRLRIAFNAIDLGDLRESVQYLPYTDTYFRGHGRASDTAQEIDVGNVLFGVLFLGALVWIALALML